MFTLFRAFLLEIAAARGAVPERERKADKSAGQGSKVRVLLFLS